MTESDEETHRVVVDGLTAKDAVEVRDHIADKTGIKREAIQIE